MKKKIIELKVEKTKYPNISVGKYKDCEVEFKGSLPGQKVKVKCQRKKAGKIKAKFLEKIEDSPLENLKKYCPNESTCGGCSYQKMGYESELLLKYNMIKDLFKEHDIDFKDIRINQSPKIKAYRNKMEYTFGDSVKGGILELGLHKKDRFYEIQDTTECNIVDLDFEIIRKRMLSYAREKGWTFYHKKTHQGFLRNLVIKKALNNNEILVNLVTTSDENFDDVRKKLFVHHLLEANTNGTIKSVIHTVNNSLSDAIVVEEKHLLFGRDYIEETLLGLTFRIGAFSFFQPNVYTAERLYQKAFEMAEIGKKSRVLDLYSGTGTITQIMALNAQKASGIEIVEEAVEKAKENVALNQLDNCKFICGDVLKKIDEIEEEFDVVVMDPPREGIHPKAIKKILELNPEKFLYISCNPKTQVRDIKILLESGYKLEKYEIYDQFPRTRHVETIALIQRVES